MSKQFVDKILTTIIHQSSINTIQIIEALLRLQDNKGNQLFKYTVDDDKMIVVDESSNKTLDNVIVALNRAVDDLLEMNRVYIEQIEEDTKELKDDGWTEEEQEELKEDIQEYKEIVESNAESIAKIKETLEILKTIKENHVYMPKPGRARFVTTMDADVLTKDLQELIKGKNEAFRKDMHELLLEDLHMLEDIIELSITKEGTLVLKTAQHGNGIHKVDQNLFYKDKPNNIRIYFMVTGEPGNIVITVLAIMKGHVGGKKEDKDYRDRIVSERQKRWQKELDNKTDINKLADSYKGFKAYLRKKIFERKSPTIDALAKIIKQEMDKKKVEGKVGS